MVNDSISVRTLFDYEKIEKKLRVYLPTLTIADLLITCSVQY